MAKLDAAAPVGESTIDITQLVQRAVDLQGEYAWWVLYGPSGHGKTTTLASAASNFPVKIPSKEIIKLEGVGLVQFDRNGVDSLPPLGLDLPVLDFSRRTTVAEIRQGVDLIPYFVKNYGIKTLGIDMTTLDKYVLSDLQPKFGEKFGLYQTTLAHHGETLKTLRGLACNVIFICHSKAKIAFEGKGAEAQEARILANETPGDFSISVDLSGQTKEFIRNQCSAMFPLIAERLGRGNPDYAIYPNGYQGKFEYKNRYRCFQDKESQNLYGMLQRARGEK